MASWKDAPIVNPEQQGSSWQDAKTVEQEQEPRTLSGRILKSLQTLGGFREAVPVAAANAGVQAVSGIAGIAGTARPEDIRPDKARYDFLIPKEYRQPEPTQSRSERGAENVSAVQGALTVQPITEGGRAATEAISTGIETAGKAIKYPLSAVPFAVGGEEEQQKFMEMPMSQYLGELAQDNGASPLISTLAHMAPDLALTSAGVKGGRAAKAGSAKPAPTKPPTIDALKQEASALYDLVDNSGVRISDDAFRQAVDSIRSQVESSGARRSLAPKTWKALDEIADDAAKGDITLKKAEELRRVLKQAQKGVDSDKSSATRALAAYDEFIEGLSPEKLSAAAGKETAEYLKSARGLWSRARKAEQIEDIIDTAGINAGAYTGSGYENALRMEFRKLARRKDKMRMFTQAEQKAIRAVAMGTPIGNVLRQLGRFSLQSGLNAGMAGAAGVYFLGPLGAAVPAVASLARFGATRSTIKGAEKAAELMRKGSEVSP